MAIDIKMITPRQKLIIAKGLCDYQYIMDNWQINDDDFQKVYYDFYLKARWAVMSKESNRRPYFHKLQTISPADDLIDIVNDLMREMEKHSYELSLVSKLLHTRNSSSPIYDSKVREYLSREEGVEFWWNRTPGMRGKSAPKRTAEIDKIKHDWLNLCDWYKVFLQSSRGLQWIEWFDNNFPSYNHISNVKKIDFIIFATN